MAKIKKARAKKSQNLREGKPVGALSPRREPPGGEIRTSETMPRTEVPPTPRMALIEIMPTIQQEMIAVAAYFKAEKRGFIPGGEIEDWLEAEHELNKNSRLM
jgi:Protein of unknown function (DUF2934)